jgi:hypothetical protein
VRLQVADFIEEDGSPVGQLQLPALALVGARKGPSLMPEQLDIEQLFRQRHAVDHHKGLIPP